MTSYQENRTIGEQTQPLRGVAMHDLNLNNGGGEGCVFLSISVFSLRFVFFRTKVFIHIKA